MRPLTKLQAEMLRAAAARPDGILVVPRHVRGSARSSSLASLRERELVTSSDPPRITATGRARVNVGGLALTLVERAALLRLRYVERIRSNREATSEEELEERAYARVATPRDAYDRLVASGLAKRTLDNVIIITDLGAEMLRRVHGEPKESKP